MFVYMWIDVHILIPSSVTGGQRNARVSMAVDTIFGRFEYNNFVFCLNLQCNKRFFQVRQKCCELVKRHFLCSVCLICWAFGALFQLSDDLLCPREAVVLFTFPHCLSLQHEIRTSAHLLPWAASAYWCRIGLCGAEHYTVNAWHAPETPRV